MVVLLNCNGADNQIRTDDLHVGNVSHYHCAIPALFLVVGQGFEPCRSSPSDQSPELIRLRRIPMLPTIISTLWLPEGKRTAVARQVSDSSKVYD